MFKDFCSRYEDVKIFYAYYYKKGKKMNISFVKLGEEECERCDLHKSNKIKQFILLHDFYKFWYTLTKIKWLNIYNGKSCVGRRLVRKPYISQDHITRRQKVS